MNAASASRPTAVLVGVVRIAHEHQTSGLVDRGQHRVEIVPGLIVERNALSSGASDLRHDRVSLERTPGEHHSIAGSARDLQQLLQQSNTPRADGDVGRGYVEPIGEAINELTRAVVGVAVQVRERQLGGAQDRRQRRVWILIARQLVGDLSLSAKDRGLTGLVRGHRVELGAEAGGLARHLRPSW